ncbi:aldo/keto reductase [Flexithrix dorotheae]|uniref:aldo/keto reductase n=1 Tax=Flexithrix dorotheae TaxID=70993 RepID=UPI000367B84F|nr:aldo/keto reductase [Flexithrix dorotheae]
MTYQQLGNSELYVSKVSFGCMSLGNDDAKNSSLLHSAYDNGINFFDTADLYQNGENEISLGKAFKGIRDKVLIATKVGNQLKPDGSGWIWNPSKEYIIQAVEKSLKRLNTDYIDLYQLHGGTIEDPIDETIEAFEKLKAEGKIRYYGISSIRPNVIREYVKKSNITSVMMQYSILDRRPEESCLDLLYENNIGVLSRGGVAKGLLIDKPAKTYLNYTEKEVEKIQYYIKDLIGKEKSPAQLALQFVLQHPALSSAVSGIRTQEQLLDLVKVYEVPWLKEDEYSQLQNVLPVNFYEQHR